MITWPVRRRLAQPRESSTPAELLAKGGRVVLWLTIALLLARGAADTLATKRQEARPSAQRADSQAVWPDDAATAFAVQFASAYLHHSPSASADTYARRIGGFTTREIAGELAAPAPGRTPSQTVESATIADVEPLDERHALITVATQVVTAHEVDARRLVVPVARDEHGGLVVYDLPSFAAAPPLGHVASAQTQPLLDADREQIEEMLGQFFRAYLSGAGGELTYLVSPGVQITAAGGFELTSRISVAEPVPTARSRDTRLVLVSLQARDLRSRAVHALRYRVELVRQDRWYVAGLNKATDVGGAQ